MIHLAIILYYKSKKDLDRIELCDKCKYLVIINVLGLPVALSYETGLVSFNISFSMMLDLGHPLTFDEFPSRRQINKHTGFVLNDRSVLGLHSFLPLF